MPPPANPFSVLGDSSEPSQKINIRFSPIVEKAIYWIGLFFMIEVIVSLIVLVLVLLYFGLNVLGIVVLAAKR